MRPRLPLLAASAIFAPISHASASVPALNLRQENNTSFSTFIYPTGAGDLTFALNAVSSTGDLYFHLSAPAKLQWVSVGTGSEMDGSVMWLIYPSPESNGLTLSSRLSDGHVEPSFSDSIDCALVEDNSYRNGIVESSEASSEPYYSANVHCKNVTALGKNEGKLDLTKTKQSFLYGWGPADKALSTTDKNAGIRRHEAYGTFWMDMTKATSAEGDSAAVPSGAALSTITNAEANGGAKKDGDKMGPAHAVIMCGTFVLIFPLGAVLLRVLENVKLHGIVQGVGAFAALVGSGVGFFLSTTYNHTKSMSSGHQIFGIVVFALVLLQLGIGYYHHRRWRRVQRPTIYGKVHLYAGPLIVLGGIINGFTGFILSGDSHRNIYYGPIVAVIFVSVLVILGWKRWSKRRQSKSLGRSGWDDENQRVSLELNPLAEPVERR